MAVDSRSNHTTTPALILGEDTVARERVGQALTKGGFAIRQASQLTEALEALEREPACLIFAISGSRETELLDEIKKRAPETDIILVTDHPVQNPALETFRKLAPGTTPKGASDNSPPPRQAPVGQGSDTAPDIDSLRRENEKLKQINRVLMENSLLDPHTGLHNERFLLQMVECEIVRSRRYNRTFSLLFVNIDLISTPGSDKSEEYNLRLLQVLAEQLRNRLRRSDLLACYQDGIFGILLPETGREGAFEVADALCGLLETTWMLSFADRTSMALGFASYPEDGDKASELFRHAIQQISH